MRIDVELTGIDGVLNTLRSLPPEVVSKRGGPVLAALKKGARVILKQERLNLQSVTSNATASGKKESTGLLAKSLTVKRGRMNGGNGERVIVTTKKAIYAGRVGKPVSVRKTGALLELGSSQQPAEPWVRPAFNAKAREAITTVETELVKGIDKIVKKLAQQNRGR
jgi:HK97 gp10 family phage protein